MELDGGSGRAGLLCTTNPNDIEFKNKLRT